MLYLIEMLPSSAVNVVGVQEVLNKNAQDWYRFATASWIVYSNERAAVWTERLRPFANNLFVCRLDLSDRQGWMPAKFWEWLSKYA